MTATKPKLTFADVGTDGQARLLDMTYGRLVTGISTVPISGMAFGYWQYSLGLNPHGLWLWTLSYLLAGVAVRLQHAQYRRDREHYSSEQALGKWLPMVNRAAVLHGLGLAATGVITAGRVPFEFTLLQAVIITAIVAANASQLSPVLGVYRRFANTAWLPCMAIAPWAFPDHWLLVLPLSGVMIFSLDRQALVSHGFFLHQIKLEEDSAKLAEDYRRAKEEAEAALYAKNRFLTTASHDLRQPVHAMGFLIESISRRNREPALQPALQDLKQSVQSITQMFNSLLDLSRIELGAQPVNLQTVALDPLMNDVATLFREEARSRQIDLRVRLSGGRALVTVDAMLLRQSMINLMQNALRYTQRGGVLMAARRRGGDWQFEVWDTGVGIAEDDQQRIYSPFFRPEHAWRIDNAGHGLGLAVVARCADLMGASQGLSSREGRGSRFWLRLPAAQITERRSAAREHTLLLAGHGETLSGRCLIIDDEPQVRGAWQALLSSWSVEAACAASANEAIAWLDNGFEPQAIFCDQRLRSGESGFELLQALLERCPDAAGAMISGEFDSPALAQAEQEGYLVLHKPLDPEALYALLSRLLSAVVAPDHSES
ncbi:MULTISPECIES: hybrid sensor histidine kinase/response regulator [Methylomonas]|uniref:histidine kinase n=2 Tax=Methylomonas TaxID=416 RepID=A0A126T2X2_9GAMM|nr:MULTISPECIES: hybrid sensor histidine kinase/response regulator [Methylomonas]AMK76419.1 hybrid sensor histidine kinase/response regulator [Methylomonas denitrificans]OAH98678.1 hybrid sensor histidine kinase/response regulator [Methylomonas methanica]TCV88452.1 signal transduction histidine kinase [Methylomonas methanica]